MPHGCVQAALNASSARFKAASALSPPRSLPCEHATPSPHPALCRPLPLPPGHQLWQGRRRHDPGGRRLSDQDPDGCDLLQRRQRPAAHSGGAGEADGTSALSVWHPWHPATGSACALQGGHHAHLAIHPTARPMPSPTSVPTACDTTTSSAPRHFLPLQAPSLLLPARRTCAQPPWPSRSWAALAAPWWHPSR